MQNLSKFTRLLLTAGLVFAFYGYVNRLTDLYFFWESKSIGWALIFLGLISFLSDRIRLNNRVGKKPIPEFAGIGIIVFILLVQTILIAVTPFTDAYAVTKKFLNEDKRSEKEFGKIVGFGLIPTGAFQKTTDSQGTYGSATINLTVKGQKKFKDLKIYVTKNVDQPEWIVEGVE